MYYVSRLAGLFSLACMAAGAFLSLRFAYADREFGKNTPESVLHAVELVPNNTEYLSLRALQIDYEGGDVLPVLICVAALNPLSSAPRLRIGLLHETAGRFNEAEHWLLDAARVDRQYEPRWTLANFYYRRGRDAEFWTWMRQALDVSYGDRGLAFDLCWRESTKPEEILARAIPDRQEVVASYLYYLIAQKRFAAIEPVARKLSTWNDRRDQAVLEVSTDALIDAGDAAGAARVWSLTGHPATSGITDPNLDLRDAGHGFAWRTTDTPGVKHFPIDGGAGRRIVLSGEQPEACELLRQVLATKPGKRYIVAWESRSHRLHDPSGIAWAAAGARGVIAASAEWKKGEVAWTAADGLTALALEYRRPIGEPRAEGDVEIRNVALKETAP